MLPPIDYSLPRHQNLKDLTIRQYAAINLRVPDSGLDWLDEMIRQSLRDEFVGRALQGMLAAQSSEFLNAAINAKAKEIGVTGAEITAAGAAAHADAMLAEREKGRKI